ncbi:nucleoside diphosphate kinase regulator [Rufibacter glacialis]|uniref:Nucleoside diphosphate kinase regulator n=1 Tax=Rufibacter glacialis TaxID=1259555 RepID=A0A5M8QC07_9BACT|nr:nucleoside diphosphate kinase regulator [Rufibacter glacialis]KAA6433499.1 nucleoside diphosphate kinase regulator [Rufibacter glacialis]GGK73614.1 prokaryotic transcription elongation factor, GreA/GreB domain protein [Rufibacter glacialis]
MDNILLTEKDYERLHLLVQAQRTSGAPATIESLCKELREAKIIPSEEVPVDIVTMNSLVRLREKKSNTVMELTLSYPKNADVSTRKISVLSPVGTAILGRKVGEEVECPAPRGLLTYQIEEVIYQPEAAGDLFL